MSRNGNRKLRIGIIGAGGIVKRRHLPAFKRRSDVEIVAISNSTYESAEKFCQENVPTAVPIANWPDLVALPDIDIVWIGTPPICIPPSPFPRLKRANMCFVRPEWRTIAPKRKKCWQLRAAFPSK